MFLNLLYKSLKADIVLRRVKAFVKRLLQVSAEQNASFACGALFLLSEVMKGKPGLKLLLQHDGVRRSPSSARFRRREVTGSPAVSEALCLLVVSSDWSNMTVGDVPVYKHGSCFCVTSGGGGGGV